MESKLQTKNDLYKNSHFKNIIYFVCVFMMLLNINCFFGNSRTTILRINYDKIESAGRQEKPCKIIISRFKDLRVDDTVHIGNMRNGWGAVIGSYILPDSVNLKDIITKYVHEALQSAGFDVEPLTAQNLNTAEYILQGGINEFWFESYGSLFEVQLKLLLINKENKQIAWERTVKKSFKLKGDSEEWEMQVSKNMKETLLGILEEINNSDFLTFLNCN